MRAPRIVALLAALALAMPAAAAPPASRAPKTSAPSATTGDRNVKTTTQRLADVTPEGNRDYWLDGSPIVLWAGATPATILQYRHLRDVAKLTVEQTLAPLDGSQARGPFPVVVRTKLKENQRGPSADAIAADAVVAADLDGDGTDELVAFRNSGAVEVYSLAGPVRRGHGPNGQAITPHRVRLGAREVLLFPMLQHNRARHDPPAPPVPPTLVRVDDRGIVSIPLRGIPQDALLLGAGSVVREGGTEIEELVAVWDWKDRKSLSRHRPDGALIASSREVYVRYPSQPGVRLRSLPLSGRDVVLDGSAQAVLFIAATKPANWIRRVDVSVIGGRDIRMVNTIDGRDGAKAIVRTGEALYAVDEDGRWLTPSPSGWAPHEKPEPFFRLPAPEPEGRLVGVYPNPARDDEWLVVQTRGASARKLTKQELLEAAERFLQPDDLAISRVILVPKLDRRDPLRDERMEEERARRKITHPITTVEQWRRELPDSYAATAADAEERYLHDLRTALTSPGVRSGDPSQFLNYAEYQQWLRTVERPASTVLTFVRGGAAALRHTIAGEVVHLVESDVAFQPVSFRGKGDALTVVLPLQGLEDTGMPPHPGLHLVRIEGAP